MELERMGCLRRPRWLRPPQEQPYGLWGRQLPGPHRVRPLVPAVQDAASIPDDLLASVNFQHQNFPSFEAFLVPSEEEEDGTSFRVIGRAHRAIKSVVFVFSSGSGVWSVGTMWDELDLGGSVLLCRCYAYGCIYWKVMRANKLFKLDVNRMDFSTVDLPPHYDERDVIIVEAGKGRVGVFSHIKFGTTVYHAFQKREGEIADGCQSEIITHLPAHYDFCMVCGAEGYIFFVGFPNDCMVDTAIFSLQVRTLMTEMVCRMMFQSCYVHPYFGYPPSMSPRRILSGLSRSRLAPLACCWCGAVDLGDDNSSLCVVLSGILFSLM